MLKYLALATGLLIASDACAQASTTSLSIIITSPPSVSVACQLGSYTAPVAAGSTICPITIQPSGWNGVLALSGTDAAKFAISSSPSGGTLTVGSAALSAGTYSVTITATP